jgi:hypothetical protein
MLQLVVQSLKPRHSIVVIERNSMLHFFNVCRRMEVIRVEEGPIQLFSDILSNSGLARTGYSHEDDCPRMVIWHKILAVSLHRSQILRDLRAMQAVLAEFFGCAERFYCFSDRRVFKYTA